MIILKEPSIIFKDFPCILQDRKDSSLIINDINSYFKCEKKTKSKKDKSVETVQNIFVQLEEKGVTYFAGNFFLIPAPDEGKTWDINEKII